MRIIIINSGQSLLEMEEAVLDVLEAIQAQFGRDGVEQVLERVSGQLAPDVHTSPVPDPMKDDFST